MLFSRFRRTKGFYNTVLIMNTCYRTLKVFISFFSSFFFGLTIKFVSSARYIPAIRFPPFKRKRLFYAFRGNKKKRSLWPLVEERIQ